jgi:hypothetical protein
MPFDGWRRGKESVWRPEEGRAPPEKRARMAPAIKPTFTACGLTILCYVAWQHNLPT